MAGLVLSDQNSYRTLVSVFDGITTREFLDKKSYNGSIVKQIDDILSYVDVYNTNLVTITSKAKRTESSSYPGFAIREAVINAFAHRDYRMNADVRIEIYDDRIEIHSPGPIPDGMSVEDIMNGLNSRRNDIIVNALDKIKYMENYGTGIRRIMSAYSGFNKQPKIYSTNSQYTICLFNKNYYLNTLDDSHSLNQIFNYLKDGKVASRAEIEEELELKKSATLELLKELKLLGIIITVGKGPNTRYSLKDSKS